jgi:ubiquinone/menaquinone biosynthesis C-methylase UbiE
MTNQNRDYIHGYTTTEQERLIQQAQYWRNDLILRELNYQSGDKLLEIGCGAGAVLGILGTAFSDLKIAGIDLETKQIDYARQQLSKLGLTDVDLRVGDANKLPWDDNSFSHIYAIWFLEHLINPLAALKEARRVLKTEGTITITETDYRTIIVTPESADYRYLQDGLCELLLQSGGNPYIGQSLGNLLNEAGFNNVDDRALPFHYYSSKNRQKLQEFIIYVDSWLAPTVPLITEKLGKDKARLIAGLEWFRSIGNRDNGAATVVVYRASATR